MRIVHISPFYHPSIGGIETFCRELSIRTACLGNEVHVITFTTEEPGDEDNDGVEVHRLKPMLSWFKARVSPRARKMIKEICPDIVHIQAPAPLTQEFAIIRGYKYLATYHNDPALTDRLDYRMSVWFYRRLIFPRFCTGVDRIVCPSRSFQENSKFLRTVPEEKKCVIPNGVDVSLFTPPEQPKEYYRSKLDLNSERVGIFVGSMERWHAYKGVDVLLEALSRLIDTQLILIFIGDGELRPKHEARARRLIDKKRAKFLGKVDAQKLLDCYRASDFFVLPSTGVECAPMVLLEAMACGLPVIATNIPGPSDLVENGVNGFKVTPRNPETLETAIRKISLLGNDALSSMSANARRFAVEKYGWERVVRAYLREYNSLR